jgi:2-polyprenyl-6-methoxyphenol hydroxylase-like FAD-dependent oxidoreductase
MHGIMAKRLGHNVHILEQYPTSIREGQAAGMSTGLHGQNFLRKYDRIKDRDHFVSASEPVVLDVNLNVTEQREVPFKLPNWKTLYYRLRANFDGLTSEYVSTPPESLPTDGTMVYNVGKWVTDVSYTKGSAFTVKAEDVESGASTTLRPDLVIAADGANSSVRKLLLPVLESPYVGYLTWQVWLPRKICRRIHLNFFMIKLFVTTQMEVISWCMLFHFRPVFASSQYSGI